MPHQSSSTIEQLDVLIIGAGLSGVGAAYYLQKHHPAKSYAILEARAALGGTWDLFRYPGVRSDSDLYTYGYAFQPWISTQSIARGEDILDYLRETAAAHGIDRQIRLQHQVVAAAWSSTDARWRVEVEGPGPGQRQSIVCRWLFCAAGYYRYDQGYTPPLPDIDRFQGQVLHPQHWPEGLDYAGRRVLVIGSGATAMTLVPAMAAQAAHVTLLQRTPTYVLSLPARDRMARTLHRWLPATWAYAILRRKNIARSHAIWRMCQKYPARARRWIRSMNRRALPPGYPVDTHFNPPYHPWEQRLCIVPDGDLFQAISAGRVSVVTDRITRFTPHGVQLASGQTLAADIIVTATGMQLQLFGGMRISVDGHAIDTSRKVTFKGLMLDDVPNFCFAMGYTHASWTLKIGLLCEHFCRLLAHMDAHGHAICRALLPHADMPTFPLLDLGGGYIQRALDRLPRQGQHLPWRMPMDYHADARVLRKKPVQDPCLHFSPAPGDARSTTQAAAPGGNGPFKEQTMHSTHPITPREQLDFDLQGDIPRFWLDGDPFRTRFFDAMSIMFPEGERYFISCVRDFRDQVTAPQLQQDIRDFIRQEGQHGMVHNQFNARLRAQGMQVDRLEGYTRTLLFGWMRRFLPARHTLASTAACEHLTATMAASFFRDKTALTGADARMRALYTWHAMEEIEHRAVAFDVLQQVAKVGYLRRVYALLEATLSFNLQALLYTLSMLRSDGFSRLQRLRMVARGLWWVYGPRGVFMGNLRAYLRYFKPGFHPWQQSPAPYYRLWLDTFERTADPLQAEAAVYAQATQAASPGARA